MTIKVTNCGNCVMCGSSPAEYAGMCYNCHLIYHQNCPLKQGEITVKLEKWKIIT